MSMTDRLSSHRAAALAVVMVVWLGRGTAQQSGIITTMVSLVNEGPTVNEPIFLKFTIRNGLSEPVRLERELSLRVLRPDGRSEEGPKRGPSEVYSKTIVSLAPGGSSDLELLGSAWSDFDIPGSYIVEIETRAKPNTEAGAELDAPFVAKVAFDVGPRDPRRLERICTQLEQRALASEGPESASAVGSLAHIKDDAAVPHLVKLLRKRDKLAATVAPGLGRIGTPDAVDALISFANDESEDRRESARVALETVAANTDDPAIKWKIADALR